MTTGGINGFGPAGSNHLNSTGIPGGSGSGTGFMGFGPTGFTTPIDTVLDRFGRTTGTTIFPSNGLSGKSGQRLLLQHLVGTKENAD